MSKYKIIVHSEKCTGCMRCGLVCSDLFTKRFNLSASRIQVGISDTDYAIQFSDECNACGSCADHCFYDALQKEEGK